MPLAAPKIPRVLYLLICIIVMMADEQQPKWVTSLHYSLDLLISRRSEIHDAVSKHFCSPLPPGLAACLPACLLAPFPLPITAPNANSHSRLESAQMQYMCDVCTRVIPAISFPQL